MNSKRFGWNIIKGYETQEKKRELLRSLARAKFSCFIELIKQLKVDFVLGFCSCLIPLIFFSGSFHLNKKIVLVWLLNLIINNLKEAKQKFHTRNQLKYCFHHLLACFFGVTNLKQQQQ